MKKFNLDFDDTIDYYIVKKYKMEGIVSFDKRFDRTDIKRVELVDLLQRYPKTRQKLLTSDFSLIQSCIVSIINREEL